MTIHANVLDLIGDTPIVRINHLDTGPCELFIKLESQNPGGSVKDRIGLSMIEEAEQSGKLKPGMRLVEGTAGNTGIGLALVAAQKGYPLTLVIPDKMSREKISNLKAMGADVVLTRSDVAKGHPEYYQDLAKRLASEMDDAFFINQFGNPANPRAHQDVTGPEIWRQMEEDLDAIVFGVGSSGTGTGLSKFFAKTAPDVELVIADPEGSILAEYINEGRLTDKSSSWLVEGIGEDFLPVISDFSRVNRAYSISDRDSFLMARELLKKEGILGGSSTGTLVEAAVRYCREQTEPKRVLTFCCDTGNRYLSKVFSDLWMQDHGLIEGPSFGDLRDLIARPYSSHDTVVVAPKEPLGNAYKRMKLYDVSQLPVMDGEEIVGLLDESDLLLAVMDGDECFDKPVSSAMTSDLTVVQKDQPVEDLVELFNRDLVAIVMDDDQFLGLVTKVDLLGYLRRTTEC